MRLLMLIATVAAIQQAGPPTAPALDAPGLHGCTPFGLSLRWAPAQDDTRVARYEVAVDHLGEGSSPTVVKTIEAPAEQPAAYEHFVDGDADYPLVSGHTYEVSVRAVDDGGAAGEPGRQTFTMPAARPVTGLGGAFSGATVELAWDAAAGACGYDVHREDVRGPLATLGAGATGFTDPAPVRGTSVYTVIPRDRRGPVGEGTSVSVSEPLPAIPASPTCAWRGATMTSANLERASMASVCLVNHERVRRGLQPFHVDPRLAAAAVGHARDEAERGFFDHTNPDGCDPSCRARAAGYPQGAGENIFAGPDTAADAVRGWMDSPGHRDNILGDYRTMGSGTAMGGENGRQWVQTFGGVPAPLSAVSGLEPQYQGPADPDAREEGGGGTVGAERRPARLRVRSARTTGAHIVLSGTITPRAGGRVRFSLRARGRTFAFTAPIRAGRFKARRLLPRRVRSFSRATLTVRYAGDADVRAQRLRLFFR